MDKIAFFDFNGTLTKNNNSFDFLVAPKKSKLKKFIYRHFGFLHIVRALGINLSLKNKKTTQSFVENNSKAIKLRDDVEHVLKSLKNSGYTIIIISGGFEEVIKIALKDNLKYIDKIYSNNLVFEKEKLKKVKVNPYDFKGKENIVSKYINDNLDVKNSIFICNSFNDSYVLTLPIQKFCFNKKMCKDNVQHINSLSQILDFAK